MNTEDLELILNNLSNQASFLLRDSLNISIPLYKENSDVTELVQFVVSNLFTGSFSTSESTLLLIRNYRLWDAHVLYRTLLEGTVKLMFIVYGSKDDIIQKCNEFWNVIPEMKLISRHKKAQDNLSTKDSMDNGIYKPMEDLVLTEEEITSLERKYPKKLRKQMEQKWSFSEIVRTLSASGEPAYDTLVSTYHDYAIGSHLIHMDGDAIGIIWDRNNRESERRIALELAHGVRLISAILTYAAIRTEVYYKLYKLDASPMNDLKRRTITFTQEIEEHYKKWLNLEYTKNS